MECIHYKLGYFGMGRLQLCIYIWYEEQLVEYTQYSEALISLKGKGICNNFIFLLLVILFLR